MSTYRPKSVPGHNVVTGWFSKKTKDAIDWFAPAGTPVYAVHGGTVEIRPAIDCVIITNAHYKTVYAHLHIKENLLHTVQPGEQIGWIGRKLKDPHLHFELQIDGSGVTAKTPKELSKKLEALLCE